MKRKNVSRLIALTMAILVFSVAMLTGCGSSSKDNGTAPNDSAKSSLAGTKITVLLPKHEMDSKGFMEKETRNFEKETGITVELINMAWETVADRVTTEMAAGGSSYDVIEFDNSWVPKFVKNDWIIPIDSYVTKEMKDGILPGLINKFSYENKLYGIPWNNDTRFFMYNKKKLADAGIANPPRTWDELAAQSKILKDKGLVKYGYIDSYDQSQGAANELTYAVYSFGGDFMDASGKLTVLSDSAVKKTYEFLRKGLNEDKFIDPASLTSDYVTAANVFCAGDTAFMLQAWPGVYSQANDPAQSKIVGEIAVAPYSVGVDDKTNAVLTLPEAMAIPKTSKNKDAAWKYIQYMSSKDFDKRKALDIGALPIWKDLFSDADLLKSYPYWDNFGKQALYSKGLQDILWYDQFSSIMRLESQKILLNQESVDEGLKQIEEQSKQVQSQQ